MRNRNKELPLIEKVEIVDAGAEGMAIARVEGMVVFVPYAVPGDVADIQICKKRRNYAEGKVVRLISPSPQRVEPECPHFGICGGCKWQVMSYEAQLVAKQKQVRDNLERIGKIDCKGMRPICGSDKIYRYRNKLEFTFSSKAWHTLPSTANEEAQPEWGALGFHIPRLFDRVLPIEHCALQDEPCNAIRLAVRDYATSHSLSCYDIKQHTGFLRNLVLRCNTKGEWMVIVIVAENSPNDLFPLLDMLHTKFPQITSLLYIINSKMNDSYADLDVHTYWGNGYIEESMLNYQQDGELKFIINPKSFYQTNSQQAQKLYSYVAELAELRPTDTLYDLYTGTGTIALFLANMVKKVVGIEYVEEAIADAKINAKHNGFCNTAFFAGDMAKVFNSEFIAEHGTPDVVVTDPPRAGMHEKVIAQLLTTRPRKIVYVSCNPATQARDLQLLSPLYEVGRIQPVDMFPHTQHVENIVELLLK